MPPVTSATALHRHSPPGRRAPSQENLARGNQAFRNSMNSWTNPNSLFRNRRQIGSILFQVGRSPFSSQEIRGVPKTYHTPKHSR